MFVNIVRFPPVRPGQDEAFRSWFACSNEAYAKHPGFVRRRILRPRGAGPTSPWWSTRCASPTQAEARRRVAPLLDGDPAPEFYEVVFA